MERSVGVVVDLLVLFACFGQVDATRKLVLVIRTCNEQLTVTDPVIETFEDFLLVHLGVGGKFVPSKPCVHGFSSEMRTPIEVVDERQKFVPALNGVADNVDHFGVHPGQVVELHAKRVFFARLERVNAETRLGDTGLDPSHEELGLGRGPAKPPMSLP